MSILIRIFILLIGVIIAVPGSLLIQSLYDHGHDHDHDILEGGQTRGVFGTYSYIGHRKRMKLCGAT